MQTLTNESFSSNNSDRITYAGFFARMLAYVIDIVIASVAVGFIKVFVLGGTYGSGFFSTELIFNYSLVDIIGYILKVSYFIISLYCSETTVGKYIMKLKVVRADGGKLSLFNIIYRETVGRFISSFVCIGYLLVLIDKEKAALHDKLCDSRVIYSCNVKKTVIVNQHVVPPQNMPYQNPPQNNMPPQNMQSQNSVPPQNMQSQNNIPSQNDAQPKDVPSQNPFQS